ncbi:MAG: protein phosphatase 2C domain-containing protein [Steroidobacteraceae bacterium]
MINDSPYKWSSASSSITGNVRKINEDSCIDMPAVGLWAVADGMGGHNAGDVASRMITESLAMVRPQGRPSSVIDDVENRLLAVNNTLYRRSVDDPNAGLSGSTVAVLLVFDRYTISMWAGDSRVYRSRGTVLEQVTTDHSELHEHSISNGGISGGVEPAQNVITRAVGGTDQLHVDIELRELQDGDHYLICSDGLYKELNEAQIGQYLSTYEPRAACKAMIEHAQKGECIDNVTVAAVQFREIR